MPDCFVETPDGTILDFNGIDPVVRWDTFSAAFADAGLVAPTAATIIGGSGAGGIVGQFQAYVRFLDKNRNPSNLSPISNEYEPAVTSGAVTGASYASPIVITTSAAHGLATGQIVKIKNVAGNTAANGIWTATVLTATTFSIALTGANSVANGVYLGGGTVETGVSTITYSNVDIPTDNKVIYRQILRNRDGDAVTFYVDIETEDLTSTVFSSTNDNDSLEGAEAVPLHDGAEPIPHDLNVVAYGLPPNFKSVAAMQQGRMFAACDENYVEGNVAVTAGSAAVTGIGVEWNMEAFAGRYLNVVGSDKSYKIDYLPSLSSLVLTEVYAGTTDPYAQYSISPPADERRGLYWSQAEMPEAWPATENKVFSEDPGSGNFSGLMSMRTYLYVLAEQRIYRFSFEVEPFVDGFSVQASQRGCVNNRCWALVEQSAYMLDFLGPHYFSGNDDQPLGTTEIQDLFKTDPDGRYRINWKARKYFHGCYDPGTQIMRWWVCLGGYYTPQHALCYQVRLRRWWIEEYAIPIASSCLGRLNGRPQVFVGTTAGRILALERGTLDGPNNGGTVRSTVTTSGLNWLADSAATFPSSADIVGFHVVITEGRGKGQERIVTAVSGTRLTINIPWCIVPDTTSTYQLGGISWQWRTPWLKWSDDADQVERGVELQFKPLPAEATLDLRAFTNLSADAEVSYGTRAAADEQGIGSNDGSEYLPIDTDKLNGYARTSMAGYRERCTDGVRFVGLELSGVQGTSRQTLYRVRAEGVER